MYGRLLSLLFPALLCFPCRAQSWTQAQLDQANTAKDIPEISKIEKQAIMYVNLARLFPRDFITFELRSYQDPYHSDSVKYAEEKNTLADDLEGRHGVSALFFDKDLYDLAKCFAEEQGNSGATGHNRKKCLKLEGASGECCSYGMNTGKDIAMQWLIDHGIPSHGHRLICLGPEFSKIGLSEHSHKKYGFCAVADFR